MIKFSFTIIKNLLRIDVTQKFINSLKKRVLQSVIFIKLNIN